MRAFLATVISAASAVNASGSFLIYEQRLVDNSWGHEERDHAEKSIQNLPSTKYALLQSKATTKRMMHGAKNFDSGLAWRSVNSATDVIVLEGNQVGGGLTMKLDGDKSVLNVVRKMLDNAAAETDEASTTEKPVAKKTSSKTSAEEAKEEAILGAIMGGSDAKPSHKTASTTTPAAPKPLTPAQVIASVTNVENVEKRETKTAPVASPFPRVETKTVKSSLEKDAAIIEPVVPAAPAPTQVTSTGTTNTDSDAKPVEKVENLDDPIKERKYFEKLLNLIESATVSEKDKKLIMQEWEHHEGQAMPADVKEELESEIAAKKSAAASFIQSRMGSKMRMRMRMHMRAMPKIGGKSKAEWTALLDEGFLDDDTPPAPQPKKQNVMRKVASRNTSTRPHFTASLSAVADHISFGARSKMLNQIATNFENHKLSVDTDAPKVHAEDFEGSNQFAEIKLPPGKPYLFAVQIEGESIPKLTRFFYNRTRKKKLTKHF